MQRFRAPGEARRWCREVRAEGATLGFVATMGALHGGHLELVRRARDENDHACVSVFVNPLQFNDPGDLERYPRDFDGDAEMLEEIGCAMVFTGTLAEFFPGELAASGSLAAERLVDPGPWAEGLEGEFRPGHFAGVATIVERMFDVVEPDRAYFGQKDFQQALTVRALAERRGAPEVVVCPTVREPSGLALSSRNLLLDEAGRRDALAISAALSAADRAWRAGERSAAVLEGVMGETLARSSLEVEYAAVRDPERWTPHRPEDPLAGAVALIGARVGPVRLIDNQLLGRPILGRHGSGGPGGSSSPIDRE